MSLQIEEWMTFGMPGEERMIANRLGLNEMEIPTDAEIKSLSENYKQEKERDKYLEMREYTSMWN